MFVCALSTRLALCRSPAAFTAKDYGEFSLLSPGSPTLHRLWAVMGAYAPPEESARNPGGFKTVSRTIALFSIVPVVVETVLPLVQVLRRTPLVVRTHL